MIPFVSVAFLAQEGSKTKSKNNGIKYKIFSGFILAFILTYKKLYSSTVSLSRRRIGKIVVVKFLNRMLARIPVAAPAELPLTPLKRIINIFL